MPRTNPADPRPLKGWVITKDEISYKVDASYAVGIKSAPDFDTSLATVMFRLYDDDGELYYEGLITSDSQTEEEIFGPLDWGMGYAGTTEMQVLNGEGLWETV